MLTTACGSSEALILTPLITVSVFKSIWTLYDIVSGQCLQRSNETSSVIGYWSLHGKISWSLTYAGTKWHHHGEFHRCVFLIGQKRATTRELSARTREGFMAWMALHMWLVETLRATPPRYARARVFFPVSVFYFGTDGASYTFATYAQTFYIITNRGEAFLALRREDLFLVCACFNETFQSVHQIICELFSYWIIPPSLLLPRLSFWAYLHAPDLSNLPANLSFHSSIKPCVVGK